MRLCKKYFAACGSRILFCETHHFHDLASRNHENDVSHKIKFGAKRREDTFYTTPHSLDGDIFFLILLRKIRKKMSPSKYNLARSAEKRLQGEHPLGLPIP